MKSIFKFKLSNTKTSNLVFLLLECAFVIILFGCKPVFTKYDYQLMPLFFIFVISHLRNKHKLKIDNFYPIKLGDDNQNLFHLSVILIPFIILFMMYSGSLQMMSQSELIFSSIFLAPIVEEFIFRHYLINRLTDIYGNSHKGVFLSIIISSLIFAMGHSYQGIFGVIIAGLKGVVFAGLYLLYRKNLVVPTLTHSLNNLLTFL